MEVQETDLGHTEDELFGVGVLLDDPIDGAGEVEVVGVAHLGAEKEEEK